MPTPLHFIAHKSARRFLNIRLGWQFMRDPNVPVIKKIAALGIGVTLTLVLMALEVPLEGILALIAPLVGAAADIAIDGAEMVILPLLLALAILPMLHRENAVVRAEN
jgi:hypothetical protein